MRFVAVSLVAVVVSMVAQTVGPLPGLPGLPQNLQHPDGRVDENALGPLEKQIPPDHYCKRAEVPIDPKREPRAHACSCSYSCTYKRNAKGEIVGIENEDGGEHSSGCKSYCSKNGRTCTCHIEEPCLGSMHGNAMADMNGNVVAVRR